MAPRLLTLIILDMRLNMLNLKFNMQRLGLILGVLLLAFFSHANQCTYFLEKSPYSPAQNAVLTQLDTYFKGAQSSKFIGLFAKDSSGQIHTALGPIVGSSHSRLLERLEDRAQLSQRSSEISEILWAGELHLKPQGKGFLVLEINETAGLNEQLIRGERPQFINSSKVENAVQILSKNNLFEFNALSKVQKFNPSESSSHILSFVSAKDFRHEMGNQFNVLGFVEMISGGHKFVNFLSNSDVMSIKNNLISILEFVKVYQQEVHIDMPLSYKNDLVRLVSLESAIKRLETESDFQNFAEKTPRLFESIKTAYGVFAGNLNFESIITLSDVLN